MSHRFRRLTPGALAVVLLGVLSSCATSAASPADTQPSPGCNIYDNLTEHIAGTSANLEFGAYPAVGDSTTYITHLYNAAGQQVGTVTGKANIPFTRPNGDIMEYSEETIELPGGTIDTQGFYDITKGLAGAWLFIPAVGTGGGYKGKLGKRSFQITKVGESLNARIEVCPVK